MVEATPGKSISQIFCRWPQRPQAITWPTIVTFHFYSNKPCRSTKTIWFWICVSCHWLNFLPSDMCPLGGEILDNTTLSGQQSCLETVAKTLRLIGLNCLDDDDGFLHGQRSLRRILRLFNKKPYRDAHPAHEELIRWIDHKQTSVTKEFDDQTSINPDLLELLHFLAEEAEPLDILQALSKWSPPEGFHSDLIPVLHSILPKGASTGSELSTALFHIKIARQHLAGSMLSSPPSETQLSEFSELSAPPTSIWKAMASGILTLDK